MQIAAAGNMYYVVSSTGPSTDPCGTLLMLSDAALEYDTFILIRWQRLFRLSLNQVSGAPDINSI